MKVSVIISARNEYPQILFTVHSILEDLGSFLKLGDYEVIIVNNLSTDSQEGKRAIGGTIDFLMARGMYHNGLLRVMDYPFASNVGARNFGAKHARGEYIFFSDGHMFFAQGTFERWLKTIVESGGIVHPAVSWIGAYPPQKGYGYSIKIGEETIKGTWNNYLNSDGTNWFYVPGMGHCALGMKKEQFIQYGGYIENRCYGGGEMYLDFLWWMNGSVSVTEPRINAYHLSSGRGYSYNHDDYIYNIFSCAYALGADMWLERGYINYLRKHKKQILDKLLTDSKINNEQRRKLVLDNIKTDFNSLLKDRPWDKLNDEKFGSHNSGLLVFQPTWLELIKKENGQALEAYKNSKYQEELRQFISDNLWNFVYGKDKYNKDDILI